MERFSGAVRTACDIQIDGRQGAGMPKLTLKKLTEKDCLECKPKRKEHLEIRCEICYVAASRYLEGGPLMWMMMPLHLHVNQKSDYDDDDSLAVTARSGPPER